MLVVILTIFLSLTHFGQTHDYTVDWDLSLLETMVDTLVKDFAACLTVAGEFPEIDYQVPIYLFSNDHHLADAQENCPDTMVMLHPDEDHIHELGHFSAGYHTVIFLSEPTSRDVILRIIQKKVLSNILKLALIAPHETDHDLFLVYSHNIMDENDIELLDIWIRGQGFRHGGHALFSEDMLNLHGRVLRATGFDFAPFTTSHSGGTEFDGIEFQIFKDMGKAMNFTPLAVEPKTGIKWDGVISDILQGETDFGVSHLFLTYPRAKIMDYTPSIMMDYYCFLVPPGEPHPRWMGLFLPLHWTTWMWTVITCVVCLLFVALYGKYYKYAEMGPGTLAFYLYGTFVDHSHGETFYFRNNGIKLFILCFLMCFFVLTMGYRGSLISYFTAPYFKRPMNTLEEVVNSPLQVRSLGNTVKTNLYLSTDPLMLKLDAKYEIYNNLEQGFRNVTERKVILLESNQMSRFRIANDYSDHTGEPLIHIARECVRHFPIVFYMPKNNIYTAPINTIITRLKESGLTLKRVQDLLGNYRETRGFKKKPDKAETLSVFELQGAFLIVAIFNGICCIVLFIEMAVHKFNEKNPDIFHIHISEDP